MADDAIRETIIKRFHSIPGLGLSKAELLYDAGYTTIASLQKADVDALAKVKGISPALARYVQREAKKMSDDVPSEMVSCSTELTATSKPDEADSASIKVDHEAPGTMNIDKPVEEVPASGDGAAEPAGEGMFSGLIKSVKSFFGGGKTEPAAEQPKPEEAKPAEDSSDTVTIKEDTGEAKPEEPKPAEPKETSDAKISVDHKEEPKPEPKKEPEAKAEPSKEPKPTPKKGGENEKLVEDIIKELDLDKEHR